MAYFVRNLKTPTMGASLSGHVRTLYYRELLLFGGWSEVWNNGDAAWATCVPVIEAGGASGFQVATANPRIIYSSAGVFLSTHQTDECTIFLYSANSQNRIAARIKRYIDANNVEIDDDSAPPLGWLDEGGVGVYIPGRIVRAKAATLTATSASARLQAPTGNNQARVLYNAANVFRAFARPKGGAAIATEVPSTGIDFTGNAATTFLRMHAIFDGNNALVYETGNYANTENGVMMWGELDDEVAADVDPGFIYGHSNIAAQVPAIHPMYMLDGAPSPAQIRAYPVSVKWHPYSDYYYLLNKATWRLQNGQPGKLALRRPLVMLANILNYGGCIRGRLPVVRFANVNLERQRPVDAPGNWLHLVNGLIVPRNGPNDPLPIAAYGAL